ncbi:MAG: hypothetical protein Harvfovirus41_8 [Harvfovirus sp.]|uniref:Uncharacterized protein n=1 Tax=Harvfovirus sp. TaxID=2487768 RepID=A0A3G5A6U0_9VIRU|nr:MAG: hypothetical protein Harvfovirus41_8 [Harvfovirus sp.]
MSGNLDEKINLNRRELQALLGINHDAELKAVIESILLQYSAEQETQHFEQLTKIQREVDLLKEEFRHIKETESISEKKNTNLDDKKSRYMKKKNILLIAAGLLTTILGIAALRNKNTTYSASVTPRFL